MLMSDTHMHFPSRVEEKKMTFMDILAFALGMLGYVRLYCCNKSDKISGARYAKLSSSFSLHGTHVGLQAFLLCRDPERPSLV